MDRGKVSVTLYEWIVAVFLTVFDSLPVAFERRKSTPTAVPINSVISMVEMGADIREPRKELVFWVYDIISCASVPPRPIRQGPRSCFQHPV